MNMVYSFGQNYENKIEEKKLSLQNYKKKKVSFFIGIGLLCLLTAFFPFVFFGCADKTGEIAYAQRTAYWATKAEGETSAMYGAYNSGSSSYFSGADKLIATIGGRKFYHRYAYFAYVGVAYEPNGWVSPVVVSKTAEGAQYYCDYCISLGNNHHCCESYSAGVGYVWFHSLHNRWYAGSTFTDADAKVNSPYLEKWYYNGGSHAMQVSGIDSVDGSGTQSDTGALLVFSASQTSNIEQNVLDMMTGRRYTTTTEYSGTIIESTPMGPRRQGNTFLGWYTKATGILREATQIIAGNTGYDWESDMTFYARYRPNYYSINFTDAQNDEVIGSMVVSASDLVAYDSLKSACSEYYEGMGISDFDLNFLMDGYSFDKNDLDVSEPMPWYSFVQEQDYYIPESRGISIYVNLDVISFSYQINISYTEGEKDSDVSHALTYEDYFYTPELESVPAKTGYTFSHWYVEGYDYAIIEKTYGAGELVYVQSLVEKFGYSAIKNNADSDNGTVTLYFIPVYEISSYTLTIKYQTYYDASVHPTDVMIIFPDEGGTSISGGEEVFDYRSRTISRGQYIYFNSQYRETSWDLSFSVANSSAYYYIQINDNAGSNEMYASGNNYVSLTWTPTSDMSVQVHVIEKFYFDANGSEGIATAQAKSDWMSARQWTSAKTREYQGAGFAFKAELKDGYVFDGWYDENGQKVSSELEFIWGTRSNPGGGGLKEDLTLTAKAKRIYDMIEYNSAEQYFYFKDGLYPQSYAGWDLTDALNTKYNNKTLTAEYSLSIAGQECPVVLYNNYYYARVWSATEKNLQITPNANPIYFGTYYFWYKLEPIVWRVSDYGVSIDYYADVLYDRFEADGGVIYGVSDLVVDFGHVDSATNKETGWKYGSSEMYRNNSSNYASLSAEFSSSAVGTWSFDQISDESTNSKIVSYDRNVLGFVQASVKDIDRLFQSDNYATVTNGKNYNVHNPTLQTSVRTAKASDLVCVLMGIDYDDNASYTTRDLYDNSNSFRILTHGAKTNRFFDNACGVRLAYAVNGKSGTTNTVTLATGSTFNETLKRAFDSSVIGVNYEDQTVGSITFGKLNAQGKYYNANNMEITSSNPYIDVSSALNVSIKAYITEGAGGLKDIYVLSDKYILANAESDALFHWFSKLKFVRFDNFFTTNATDLSFFFNGCSELVEVDVSNFDTAKVTSMENMFAGIDVEELDVSSFITANVTNMSSMFSACDNLKKLDLSNFETSNVTDMNMMFWNCEALTSLNLSNFDTKNVLDMSDMFFACWELTELDLSSFKTTKVQNMDGMFRFSVNLKTIYVGTNWSTTAVTSSTDMFSYCSDIVGGNGTTYNESYVDKTYARVDASGTPGYFTFKG